METALAALAEWEGVSKQEVIRRALLDRYARSDRRARLDAISDEMLERWGDVLDRLGKS